MHENILLLMDHINNPGSFACFMPKFGRDGVYRLPMKMVEHCFGLGYSDAI
jgi:hypothetical protein